MQNWFVTSHDCDETLALPLETFCVRHCRGVSLNNIVHVHNVNADVYQCQPFLPLTLTLNLTSNTLYSNLS